MDDPDQPFSNGNLMFIATRDGSDKGKEITRRVLEEELMNQPTHIQRAAGLVEVPWPNCETPTEKQLGLMQIPQFLQCISGAWSSVEMADRLAIMKYCDHPVRYALRDDLLDIIDWMPHVKGWLKNWQLEVNAGRSWWLPGRFGERAHALEVFGFLLAAPESVTDYYGHVLPARSERAADHPGSPGFVATAMGPKYLEWIQAVA
jgi:hypothetical protein